MSTCTKWINLGVITCKDWASQAYLSCTSWADATSQSCSSWADDGSNQCSQWADDGSNQCSQWADDGSNQCSSWGQCHWYTPWNCIAGWFCQAWYWVANWVCQAWCVVTKAVCAVFTWIVKAVCQLYSDVATLICVAWTGFLCMINGIFGSSGKRQSRIQHVFVLMFENRAFDHMFGLSGITGMDINGHPTAVNGPTATDTNIDPSTTLPMATSVPAKFNVATDPGHEFPDVLTSLCGAGAVYNPVPGGYPPINNSGFIENYSAPVSDPSGGSSTPAQIMQCFAPAQLPVLTALATEFAICDNWFSSLPGPTWPNRFFLLAATSGGLDGSPTTGDIISAETVAGYQFENGDIFDLLEANCLDWCIYEGDDFPISLALSGMDLNLANGKFKDFDDFASDLGDASLAESFIFIEPKYGAHIFDIEGPGNFTCGDSMHPLDDVTRGEALVKQVYEAVRNSPHWENSVLLITFDEHGGFYDHVAPPAAVAPGDVINSSYVQNHFQFDQLGVRVPAIVISPFTQKGIIDHTLYDHTSMLATVEKLFGMGNLTNRDKAANNFIHLISSTTRKDAPATLPAPAVNPHPLPCKDDSADSLIAKRSELRMAREEGFFKGARTSEIKLTPSQIGFLQVALFKVLQGAEYADKIQWIADYKKVGNGLDAAIFMIEAKLKAKYSIDFKKIMRESKPARLTENHRVIDPE